MLLLKVQKYIFGGYQKGAFQKVGIRNSSFLKKHVHLTMKQKFVFPPFFFILLTRGMIFGKDVRI